MTEIEKQSWERVRARGRDRFLLHSISKLGPCVFAAGIIVEALWWLVTRNAPESLWKLAVEWAAISLLLGAVEGKREWETKERNYLSSETHARAR